MARFSIVIPAYNAQTTLAATLDSVLIQSFEDFECVIVDDGSTDGTADLAAMYGKRDSRFVIVRQQNTGTAGAYQAGVTAASCDLLVICSADDLLLPGHLRAMDGLVRRNPGYQIFSCNGEYLDDGSGTREVVYTTAEWGRERSLSFEQVVEECFFSVGATFRRQMFEAVGGYRTGVYLEDYDFWLRGMAQGARHLYTPQVLAVHRVSAFQLTADYRRVFESRIWLYEDLIATHSLTSTQRTAVEESITANRKRLEQHEVEYELASGSMKLRAAVERAVGERHTGLALSVIHAVSWIARPFRRAIVRLRRR